MPLMAVADALKEKAITGNIDLELTVLGEGKFLADACAERELKLKRILAGKFRRYFSLLNFIDIFKIPIGFIQSLWHMFWFMPDVVFTKGGYVSFAPAIVAKLYFIPLFTHESDSVPGLTNKIIGKMAKTVFTSFPSAAAFFKEGKTSLVGNPIRKNLFGGDRTSALSFLNLDSSKKNILVLGGSQGAKIINETVLSSLVMMLKNYYVIHQCGESQYQSVKNAVDALSKEESSYAVLLQENYRLYPFFNANELAMVYAAADVIVSRAGAANIFEIAAVGKPAIIIPITKSSTNHQIKNAEEFSRFGAVLIEEANLSPNILINQIESLLKPENYSIISEKIKQFARVDAADKVADTLLAEATR